MSEGIADIAADGVADGLHIVSEEALAAESLVRSFDKGRLAFLGLGLAVGGAVGAVVAFKMAYVKAETKFSEIAAEEIAEMRQHYQEKAVAADLSVRKAEMSAEKAKLVTVVNDSGYAETIAPPMVVAAPEAVVEAAREFADSDEDPVVKPAVEEPEIRNVFQEADVEDEWDWHAERRKRSPLRPYIIHIDEREEQQAYDEVTYTYYEEDDVLANEREEAIDQLDRDKIIGEIHLNQFGHGSRDANVLYVRNDQLEMDIEIIRSPNSYAEEVHGFDPPEPEIRHSHRRSRRAFDDE